MSQHTSEPLEDTPEWIQQLEDQLEADTAPRPSTKPTLDEDDWGPQTRVVDTSDLVLEEPDDLTGGEHPPWVLVGDACVDTDLGTIKSGKEAEVRLVRRTLGDRSCLLAVKRYRARAERSFRRETDYTGTPNFNDDRVNKAVRKRSRFGRSMLEFAWAFNEFPNMRTAWSSGVRVPYPVEMLADGLAMQFIGEPDGTAAPRLVNVRIPTDQAEAVLDDLVEQVRKMLDVHLVHADLSAYNILWWDDRAWVIDMPQAVDIAYHDRGVEFLTRDLTNLCRHFRRYGVDADPEALFTDVMVSAPFEWESKEFSPTVTKPQGAW